VRFETALFDLGGTLIVYENKYSWRELAFLGCKRAIPFLKKTAGVEISAEELAGELLYVIDANLKDHLEDMVEIEILDVVSDALNGMGVAPTDGIPAGFVDIYYQPTTEQIVPEPDSVDILRELKARGMTIGLVSNSIFPARFHRDEMARFGMLEYFDFTIFSSECGIRKPNPEIYRKALVESASGAANAVFIGDRMLEDVAGPQDAGIKAILKYVERRDYSLDARPFRTIKRLKELESILLD
jgi:putative hydrolase of the HAD superfamily